MWSIISGRREGFDIVVSAKEILDNQPGGHLSALQQELDWSHVLVTRLVVSLKPPSLSLVDSTNGTVKTVNQGGCETY